MPYAAILRYHYLLEKLQKQHYPSLKELKAFLEDSGLVVSDRTLQRDIERIRDDFDVEICYDRDRNGYFIDEEMSLNLDGFLRFLEIIGQAHLLTETLQDSKRSLEHLHFEAEGSLRGIGHLQQALFAIKNHRVVDFQHENYSRDTLKEYKVHPYLLKEYQNRWYLIGFVPGISEFRTFGLDRIHELRVSDQTFEKDTSLDPRTFFEDTIGLVYSLNEKEEVILSVEPIQAKYLKGLPLHHSQEILIENEDEVQVKLSINPNYEFLQKVLMMGSNVKVMRPDWLRDRMKEELTRALEHYSGKN